MTPDFSVAMTTLHFMLVFLLLGIGCPVGLATTEQQAGPPKPVIQNFPVGDIPIDLAFDGAKIWIALSGDGLVTVLRASDGLVVANVTTGTLPAGVAFDGINIWVTNADDNNVVRIQSRTGVLRGVLKVERTPTPILFHGHNIWVGNVLSDSVSTISRRP